MKATQHHHSVIFIWQFPGNRWQTYCRHLKVLLDLGTFSFMLLVGIWYLTWSYLLPLLNSLTQFNSFANFLPMWTCEQLPSQEEEKKNIIYIQGIYNVLYALKMKHVIWEEQIENVKIDFILTMQFRYLRFYLTAISVIHSS